MKSLEATGWDVKPNPEKVSRQYLRLSAVFLDNKVALIFERNFSKNQTAKDNQKYDTNYFVYK